MSTLNKTTASRPPPSRWWYVFAAFLMICGFVFMAAFMVPRIVAIPDTLQRVVVPGTGEISVDAPGGFTIFHEQQSVVDGEVFSSKDVSGLRVNVFDPAGQAVPVASASMGARYAIGGRSGTALLTFEATTTGAYRLAADYRDGATKPRVVLAVGTGFMRNLLVTLFGALGIAFGGIGAGALVAALTRRKRRAAKVTPG